MKKLPLWILSFVFLLGSANETLAYPSVNVSCYHAQLSGFWWNYCVHDAPGSTNQDVIYYFHGINGSQYEWENSPLFSKIYELWGTDAPKVVTVSYGSVWLLAERNASRYSGLYQHFINTALPNIERARKIHPLHRMLMGLSMGGFNAAQVYLKNPELFTKVALACPALTTVGPYSGRAAIAEYTTRTNATPSYVSRALYLSSSYFPSKAAWDQSDPIALANERITSDSPPLYVSGGMQDEYGFFEGAKAFTDIAASKGVQATWTPLDGTHCTWDWEGTARFFIAQ